MWRALNVAIRTPLLGPRAGPVSAGLPLASVARKHDAQQQGHAGTAVRVSCEAADWPAATDVLCWHCCHAFDGPPLPLPIKYDDRRDVFHVCGTFCSWACMKTYNLDARSHMAHVNNATLITFFHKRCTRQLTGIRAAPPRLALKAFGGHMTIEEFRGSRATVITVPPKMIVHLPTVAEVPSHRRDRPSAKTLREDVSFKDVTVQNEMLRVRRTKPLPGHNLLVRTLGVEIIQPAAA